MDKPCTCTLACEPRGLVEGQVCRLSEEGDKMSEGVSMESFGVVSVDYFHGRRVEKVYAGDGSNGAPIWTIEFSGGALVHNYDPMISIPTAIDGAALTRTLLSVEQTRLQFGLEQVILNPLEYSIMDPIYTKGQEVYAQRSDANMPPTAPPEPEGRTAEGPDDDGA